ncbi:hypothetical protein [Hyphomonas sp.]|uniref:phage tail assembly chaperone n=1 Tax=Hyphomonas sp. TaxID=87 RepID=UPI0025C51276|nr:hypothetical protein [Hyphomonas sp.]
MTGSARALETRPDLPPDLGRYLAAFHDLSGDRQLGFGAAGSITFSTIDQYARRFHIEDGEFEFFHAAIRHLDGVFLEHIRKTTPKSQQPRS